MKKKAKQNGHILKYFERKFEFKKDASWSLPDTNEIYKHPIFTLPAFQKRKDELNTVKAQLSNFDLTEWSNHTKSRDPSTSIISTIKHRYKAEFVTQAWCKFYECVFEFPVLSKIMIDKAHINSVHLCEAPGAFICSLNHFIKTLLPEIEWNWIGSTLNPYYEGNSEMIPDDRLIRHTNNNWYFGLDLTGDITKYYNSQALIDFVKSKWKVQLITADGSIDCMYNPGDQEKLVEYLHYCETITALQILEAGGSLILKIFTMFEESTICLLYLLNCCFDKVHVFKPCTSKSGNSELYVICLNYTPVSDCFMSALILPYIEGKLDKSMFSLNHINQSFITQIYECAVFFMEKQIQIINENIKCFAKMSYQQQIWTANLINNVTTHFLNKYRIINLPNGLKVVPSSKVHSLYHIAEHFLIEDDFSLYNKINTLECDIASILNVQTGKYILTAYHSMYYTINSYSYNQSKTSKDLYNITRSALCDSNTIITFSDFKQFYGVSKFHRMFFLKVFRSFTHDKNILIVGIPLLTNFLVSLVFLISLAFKRMWFLNNVIILEKPQISKVESVKKHLQAINEMYINIDSASDVFTKDILHVVPFEYIYNKKMIKLLSRYNSCILKYES